MLVPYNLYSFGEIYTHEKINQKQECLDGFIEMSYNELTKEEPNRDKISGYGIWWIDNCFDFDWTQKEYNDRVHQLTGGIYPK